MVFVFLALLVLCLGALVVASRRSQARELESARAELAPVKKLVDEDVTALGVELQALDLELAGSALDAGARADYQRALDAYESAKTAADRIAAPDEVTHVTEILEDGRYAMACVRARVEGRELPSRRPPCFFDPMHGPSVADVTWTPPGGASRQVPACALDTERVHAGADPDVRKVMVGARRVPYWQGGRAYEPYASGYYGAFAPMQWMFMGALFWGGLGGIGGLGDSTAALDAGAGESDGGADVGGSDGSGDHGGDFGVDFGGDSFGGDSFGDFGF